MKVLMARNLKLFFRDKGAVFFSLLSIFIIIALYTIFLGDVWLTDEMKNIQSPDVLMNSWLLAGILAVSSVTTTMGAFGVMIDDKVKKIYKDFNASPIKKSAITSAYIGSAFLIGVIMSIITLVIAEIYIVSVGGQFLSISQTLKVFLLVLLATMANTSIVCFIVSFFKSHSAFSTASTIIGTLIGFLTGIYLPIGALPEFVQIIIKVFPVSQAASLFRILLMDVPMETSFNGVPIGDLNFFKSYMGVTFSFGDFEITPIISIFILVLTSVLFYSLSILNITKKITNAN